MPAYVYPEPTALVAYREANPTVEVWNAIAANTGGFTPAVDPAGITLVASDDSVWELGVDADGTLITQKL